jgi:cyclic pyranopterin phosphate synthase
MRAMSRSDIREAIRATVANRVPYYGEYLVRDESGDWQLNEAYMDVTGDRTPYEYSDSPVRSDGKTEVDAISD